LIVSTIQTSNCTPQTIVIGRRGTYDTLQIVFDLAYLIENYGNGTAVLAVKRSQDESAYPAIVTQEDATLLWTVNETDTAYVGSGECQLMWYVDGGLAKTIIYPMVVMRDILATSEDPPDGYENWIEHLTELSAETQQNAQNAAQSASDAETAKDDAVAAKEVAEAAQEAAETAVTHYPKIVDGYWYVWNAETETWVNTGIRAEGRDGYSPEVTITEIEGGHRVTITDEDHPQGQTFDVMDGQGGGGSVNDVQISGTSIVSGGVADIPLATASSPGLSYPYLNRGLSITADGQISITKASDNSVKAGTAQYAPIVPNNQHGAVFYGLAKAAGDVTQAASDNPVGTYTDNAKAAIKDMIGATAGGIKFDNSETYQSGSMGAELQEQNHHLNDKITSPTSPASGAFLVWDGTAWVAQTLATWQGGSF